MNTPYTTKSGIQIGINYQPRQTWTPTRTETMLQDALINRRRKFADWDGIVIVLGCIASVVIVYAWLWGAV